MLRAALVSLTAEGRALGAPMELLVAALKTASVTSNGVSAEEHSARYGEGLVQLLALYFEEEES
jgi:hypothetical protein